MKKKLILLPCAAALALFASGCESDTVVREKTTYTTTSTPAYGVYGTTQTKTTSTVVVDDDDILDD